MKIQVNSDKQIAMNADLLNIVKSEVKKSLERFEPQLTTVEVHLSDLNSSSKRGTRDKRCLLEVRPAGKKPVSVDDKGATVEQATKSAIGKMKRLLQSSLGREAHQTSRASLSAGKRAVRRATGASTKLGRIQAALSELFAQESESSPQFERHLKTASDALQKAQSLMEEQPAKVSTTRAVNTQSPSGKTPANGRSPKRKGIYQARRKSWPK